MDSAPSRRKVRVLLALASLGCLVFPGILGSPPPPPNLHSAPQVLLLQPDPAAGTDTFILNNTPAWNYGNNASLLVGRNAATGGVARSLLRFDTSGLPPGAQILNASLEAYQGSGGAGTIQARRAFAPWTEGAGQRSWARRAIVVRETAGVPRTLEPVGVALTLQPYDLQDPQRDLTVFSGSSAVPSQVYRYVYSGANIAGATVYFEPTVGALGTKYYNVTYSTNGTSVPSYRTATWGTTPAWTFATGATGESPVSVVDLNGDGKLAMVFGAANGYVYALNSTGGQIWATQVATVAAPYAPQVRDIDGDGKLDIIVMTMAPSLVRLNRTGSVVWSVAMPNPIYSTPTLLDVNGDGVMDVLVGGKMSTLNAYSGVDGSFLRSYTVARSNTYTASITDIDGDGKGEIVFAADDKLVHAFNRSGVQLWANAPAGTTFIENSVAVGDVNNDGIVDIVTGDDGNGGPEFALRRDTGAVVWSGTLPNYREGAQSLVDLNGDGTLESVVGLFSGAVYAVRGQDGTTLWSYAVGTSLANAPAAADLDKDGRPELVYMDQGSTVRVLNASGTLVHSWTITANAPGTSASTAQKPMTSPAIADLNGDGTMEVIVPTGSGVQAFATGGLAPEWRTWGYNWNHTHRILDGNSPDGAPPLVVTLGVPQVYPGAGASWGFADGVVPWGTAGGDFGGPEANATVGGGWASWNVTKMTEDWFLGRFPNVGLFLTEANEASGALHALTSSDSSQVATRPRLRITYFVPASDPTPRIMAPIPAQVKVEDSPPWTIDLTSFAFDNDTPLSQLRWNVTGYDPNRIQIAGLNVPGDHNLTFYPVANANGNMSVTYWLTDPQGHYATRQGWVNLTPVNDPPSFNPPAVLYVHYNSTYTFDFGPYIADVDTPRGKLTLTSSDPTRARVTGFNVSFLYPQSLLGQWVFVTLTVSDGAASVAKVVPIKVTTDNPPRVFRALPNVTMTEGQTLVKVFNLNDYFADPDHDSLFFSFGYTHLNITIHPDHSVDIRAQAAWYGQESVTFRATDPTGAIAEDTIVVTVIRVDLPPTLDPLPDLVVHYNYTYSFNLDPYIADPDTPSDQLVASTNSSYISVSGHLLNLLLPQSLNNTVQSINVSVSDGVYIVHRNIRVTVGSDWPPILSLKLGNRRFAEDTVLLGAFNLSASFQDPDGSRLFFSSGNRSVRIAIDSWGRVDLSAQPNWFGTERVRFRATDPQGALAEDTVWITVEPVDDPPYFLPIPAQYLNATTGYLNLVDFLGDVDNNVSDLQLSTSSQNASIIGQGILFNYAQSGDDEVVVAVSDGNLTNTTRIAVVVTLPVVPGEGLPLWFYWLPLPGGLGAFTVFALYRRRRIDWVYLATNGGLVVASTARRGTAGLDTDQIAGLMTAIQDFASETFSDERRRKLEGLTLGDRRVALERGEHCYLAVVYRALTPGGLPRLMRALLQVVEERHGEQLKDFMDTSTMADVPGLLQRLIDRGWWPFLRFDDGLLHRHGARVWLDEPQRPPPPPAGPGP